MGPVLVVDFVVAVERAEEMRTTWCGLIHLVPSCYLLLLPLLLNDGRFCATQSHCCVNMAKEEDEEEDAQLSSRSQKIIHKFSLLVTRLVDGQTQRQNVLLTDRRTDGSVSDVI